MSGAPNANHDKLVAKTGPSSNVDKLASRCGVSAAKAWPDRSIIAREHKKVTVSNLQESMV